MEKAFEPGAVEARWRDLWESSGAFKPSGKGDSYAIMIPPPNVTGTLHMGHAFQHTIMDTLIRHARMSGKDTLWQPGTDHAGIATQMVVERNLKLAGEPSRTELGANLEESRKEFLKKVWAWKDYSAGTIGGQIRRMGSSVDWSREAFTMDPSYSKAVIEHFVRLHDDGLIYRGKRLVNWDPVLQTAISDLEVVSEESNGKLWHFRYPLADGTGQLVVATTRPETMLGDTAVAVHPDDERYQHLIGKRVKLPLCDREIPIIADAYVDKEFGTGVVKITPAHDFNDYAMGQRHGLFVFSIFTRKATIISELHDSPEADPIRYRSESNQGIASLNIKASSLDWRNIPEKYRGLDRFVARKQIIADLEVLGLVEKIEDHKSKVPRGDRSGAVLEPYLTDQWFVDLTKKDGGYAKITKPAIDAVESGRIRFVPDNWKSTYFHWLNNIQDWCISRQLWWGHRIPAWYDETGKVYVGRSEDDVRAKHKLAPTLALKQDEDVFDTWFSSDIWPFATLGWPDKTPELKKHYPGAVLVTGFDIIFFWVARMVMMGQYFMKEVPFRDVFITGLVRDPEGNKMSKSKGNVLDPLDVVDGISLDALVKKRTTGLMQPEMAEKIEKKTRKDYPKGIAPVGVDALRFTFASLCTQGRDIRFEAGRAEGYRNFCNKLWNATRFVLMQCENQDVGLDASTAVTLGTADKWIVSRLQRVEAEAAEHLKAYRFDLLAQSLYQFVWNEYCDWYLELTKPTLMSGDSASQRGTRRTLLRVLEATLRLLHPLMPFITEDLWQRVAPMAGKSGTSVMLQPYPLADTTKIDEQAESDIEWVKSFVLGVRQIRGEMDLSPAKPLPVLMQNASKSDFERMQRLHALVQSLARIEEPNFLEPDEPAPESAVALLGDMKILVPMAGLIDKDAELARLDKQVTKLEQDVIRSEAQLTNPQFIKAPAHVVAGARANVEQKKKDLATLKVQQERIRAL